MTQRHVVVTGAGSGIGRAVAHRLSLDDAAVTLLGLVEAELEETMAELEGAATVVQCDVRGRSAVDRAFARAAATLGPVCALVAAAVPGTDWTRSRT